MRMFAGDDGGQFGFLELSSAAGGDNDGSGASSHAIDSLGRVRRSPS